MTRYIDDAECEKHMTDKERKLYTENCRDISNADLVMYMARKDNRRIRHNVRRRMRAK